MAGSVKTNTEKFTTEVVLQQYRGEVQLLDGRGDGASGGASERAAEPARTASSSARDDLDSEIPF